MLTFKEQHREAFKERDFSRLSNKLLNHFEEAYPKWISRTNRSLRKKEINQQIEIGTRFHFNTEHHIATFVEIILIQGLHFSKKTESTVLENPAISSQDKLKHIISE